jgi:hypothetical protein
MAAGNTYIPLASTTITSLTASVTFSSISSAYTDLVIIGSVLGNGSMSLDLQFNGDTATNYSYVPLDGSGTSTSSPRQTNTGSIQFAGWSRNLDSTTNPSTLIANIMNYSSTTKYKTALNRSMALGTPGNCVDAFVGTWRSTAAITSITIRGSVVANTVFSLYGIAAA